MDNFFIRYEAPWSMAYKKYQVKKTDNGYVIEVKPSWKRKRIFDSSMLGKYHKTEEEALNILNELFNRYRRNYHIEWQSEAEKEKSRYNAICYEKWIRKTAAKEGINQILVKGRYDEYRKLRGFK